MPFSPDFFESTMSGSHVNFRKRSRPELPQSEQEKLLVNQREIQKGVDVLRSIRTEATTQTDPNKIQSALNRAHILASNMALEIFNQVLPDSPPPISSNFKSTLGSATRESSKWAPTSSHSITPSNVIGNLYRATEDMLARIQEKAGSTLKPTHKLDKEETKYVLNQFTGATNELNPNQAELMFQKDAKVGGIITGGAIYLELVKLIVSKYSEPGLNIQTFVVAVDKEKGIAVYEQSKSDNQIKNVVITDDMVDKGGTILTALRNAGGVFTNAKIVTGKESDMPGEYKQRMAEKHNTHLYGLFQKFADLSEDGNNNEALKIFDQASEYAKSNKVELTQGWFIRKDKILGKK